MTNTTHDYELLSEKEVEKIYKINARTLQRERSLGIGMPYAKLGRRVRYKDKDIKKYIDARIIGGHRYD